jgi:phage FluMu protein Com
MGERAVWVIHLFADCPHCKEEVDLLDDPNFWTDHGLGVGEHGTEAATDLEVTCPECGEKFTITAEY